MTIKPLCISPYLIYQASEPSGVMPQVLAQWQDIAVKAVALRGRFSVALSGGKTPALLYRYLAQHMDAALWAKTHIFLVDERLVGADHADSNYRFLKENFLAYIPSAVKPRLHEVASPLGQPPKAAAGYEKVLRDFFGDQNDPVFDLIVLGVGEDGHTASLFPGDAALGIEDRWVAAVDGPMGCVRITLTLLVINHAEHIFFLVFGAAKAAVMVKFLLGEADLPAKKVHPSHGRMWVFTDTRAMERI